MTLVTSANIACGYHAGDADTMRAAVELARHGGVAVGAHPSYPDREHFGRREMSLPLTELHDCIVAQVRALSDVALGFGVRLRHVKPHGALYNVAARDASIADVVAAAVARVDSGLLLFALAGSHLVTAGRRLGLQTIGEVFADRAYKSDGTLVSRHEQGSVIADRDTVATRALEMVRERSVLSIDGIRVPVEPETICVHGDTPGAAELATAIRDALWGAGVTVSAPVPR